MRKASQLPGTEIYVQAESFSWGVLVEYRSPSVAALLEVGGVTQRMADQCSCGSVGRMRKDECGDKFSARRRPLKTCPERIEVGRFITDEARARTLPGVADFLREQKRATPPSFVERSAAALAELMGTAETPHLRDRTVGRHQRHVVYAAVGKLVVPDWNRVMVERLAQAR